VVRGRPIGVHDGTKRVDITYSPQYMRWVCLGVLHEMRKSEAGGEGCGRRRGLLLGRKPPGEGTYGHIAIRQVMETDGTRAWDMRIYGTGA
jgi:hypothetical protein